MSEMRSLSLPADLCQRAEQAFGEKFGSLEHLLEYVLQELLRGDVVQVDEREQRLVEERLRDLGYL